MSNADTLTPSSILESQRALLQEASEALPHSFSRCTHSLGHIRQAVYLCLTCSLPRGICAACSIACHTDHEQLELFPKRNFRCDCPTRALLHSCALHAAEESENSENVYGRNFRGAFCRCGRPYDAMKERETMIQCLACEDWYHESCLNLRERPSTREPTPDPAAAATAEEADDAASEASSSGLPPPLVRATEYEALVCGECVRRIPTLRKYAGTPGLLMVVRDAPSEAWRIIGRPDDYETETAQLDIDDEPMSAGVKRERSEASQGEPETKRARLENESGPNRCLAPQRNAVAQKILDSVNFDDAESLTLGCGDVFLADEFRGRWCQCDQCLPSLEANHYLLEEEETYEPPEDPDSGLSLEELGLRALQRLPRDRALDGIRAFNELRDDLMSHLRPFAQEDKEVTEADIRAFFDARTRATQ